MGKTVSWKMKRASYFPYHNTLIWTLNGVFQEQFQNQNNSRTIHGIQGIQEWVATLVSN